MEPKINSTELHGVNPRHTWEGANSLYADVIKEMMRIMIDDYIPIEVEVKVKYVKPDSTTVRIQDPNDPETYCEEQLYSDS